jgi:oligopeptide transport system substrate-binding protein
MKRILGWCGALAVLAVLSAWAAGPAGAATEQVLRYNLANEPKTIDPTLNGDLMAGFIIDHCFEGLLRDRNGKLVPGIAQSWSVSKDGRTYTFKLRDAKWSDGRPVRAQDFEYAWKRSLDPKVASGYAYLFYYITGGRAFNEGKGRAEDIGIRCPDPRTLVVTLENPTPYFPYLVSFMAYMPVRGDILEKDPEKWARKPETYIGEGPYRMTVYRPDQVVLEKNPAYWNAKQVKLPKIDCAFITEASTELTAFENGEFDILDNIPSKELPRVSKMPGFKAYPQLTTYFYTINTTRKPFNDPRVRKALALAIDRRAIVEKVRMSAEVPASNLIPPGMKDDQGKDFHARSGNFLFDPQGGARVEEARKLLAEAGYPGGKGFPEFTLLYNTSEQHKAMAEAVQEMWRKNLGINVKLLNQEWQVFLTTRTQGNYDVARGHWWGDFPDPVTFLDMFGSNVKGNWPRWKNPAYDSLLKQSALQSGQKRFDTLYKAHKILMDDMPIIPLLYPVDDFVIRPWVKGLERTAMGNWYMGNVVLSDH